MNSETLLRYIREIASPEEIKQVESWLLEDKENEQTLLTLSKIYFMQRTEERIKKRDINAAYEKTQKQIRRNSIKRTLQRSVGIAASFLVLLGISTFLYLNNQQIEPILYTLQSKDNQRCTTFLLPDSTVVHLNANTSLIYTSEYGQADRKVILDGEVFFEVKADKEKPFLVNTPDNRMTIEVLGTSFNVQAYANDNIAQTTLVTGSIHMQLSDTQGRKEDRILTPSDRVTINFATGESIQEHINTNDALAWMKNSLVFKNTPLVEVARQLSIFYDVEFELRGESLKEYLFTGSFENKSLSTVLDYMKISSGIESNIEETSIVLYTK
ncbi:FecR family protein [Proteiniphilum sp. UBA5384]|uniref:FecR family protein n=1 Tax=Proteiniphilum sp. UBA5384 TaxID=1947279 RepID=UPI0025E82219|nr:FecR family protein [Proteiniphilum sp. UBA5384]